MTDVFTIEKRSDVMAKIKSKNTKPEIMIRKGLHGMGYRFRLHQKDLPGKPDIVLRQYKTVINVKGCFWHHHDCKDGRMPASNQDYWKEKIASNITRDDRNEKAVKALGWNVINVWECTCVSKSTLEKELERIAAILSAIKGDSLLRES